MINRPKNLIKKSVLIALAVQFAFQSQLRADDKLPINYSLVMSVGDLKDDQNVLILQQHNDLYGFKYCRAFNADGSPTPIARLRNQRFANAKAFEQNKVLPTGEVADQNFQKELESLFSDPSCGNLIGNSFYGLLERPDPENKWNSTELWAAASGMGAIGTFFSGVYFMIEHDHERELDNTLPMRKYIFSSRFPKGYFALTLVFASIFSSTSYRTYVVHSENSKFESLDQSLWYGKRVLRIDNSIEQFEKRFEEALKSAVDRKILMKVQ